MSNIRICDIDSDTCDGTEGWDNEEAKLKDYGVSQGVVSVMGAEPLCKTGSCEF